MHRLLIGSQLSKYILQRWFILPVLVFLIGLYLSVNQEIMQRKQDIISVELALKKALDKFELQISNRLNLYSYGLNSVDSLLSGVGAENLNDDIMQSFSYRRNFQKEFPGARGFGVIQRVDSSNVDAFLARKKAMRANGEFTIQHLSDNYEHLFIIRDIVPELKNASALGLNIASETNRRDAAIAAVYRNEATITDPITLVQADKSIKQGFLVLLPFFKSTVYTKNLPYTLENTWGWSYAPIVINEVVNSSDFLVTDLIFTISNIGEINTGLFYQSSTNKPSIPAYKYSNDIPVFGKTWRFEVHATEAFTDRIKKAPYAVFTQFMVLTLLATISAFCLYLLLLKGFDKKRHIKELRASQETQLKKSNKVLESMVKARTLEIEKSASFQNAILKSSPYSIIATDETGLITMFNPAAEKLLGYLASEMIGKENPGKFHVLEEIIAQAKVLSKQMNKEIAPGFDVFKYTAMFAQDKHTSWTYVHRNGTHIPTKLNVTVLYGDNDNIIGFLGIAYDLSAQLENERIIKNERDKAEKATLAKSEFLANMSHEIRTPLNGVQGALQIIEEKVVNPELFSLVNIALRSMRSLSLLINDILDISKVEAGKIHITENAFRLDDLLDSLQQEFKQSADAKGIALHFTHHIVQQTWIGDELRIKQILTNLVSNAIKFTEIGHVNVAVAVNKNEGITIAVADTGIGMDQAGLSALFNRFEQADKSITRKYGGTGLGMAITKSLIELMNGTLSVSSKVHTGSVFEVNLPLRNSKPSDSNMSTPSENNVDLSNFSILVAEDNEINQIIVQTMLVDVGANVVLVSDGQQAIDIIEKQSFDLILLDIQMPVLDGMKACSVIKKTHPLVPIIALTANVFSEDIEKYKQTGFDAIMGKPFEKDKLITLIHKHLH